MATSSSHLAVKSTKPYHHHRRATLQRLLAQAKLHLAAAGDLFGEASVLSGDSRTAQSLAKLARAATLACAPIARIRREIRG
jgi:hypothetical protein